MHLQQTKRGSRKSGGPQYYFHDLDEAPKLYLRDRGAVCVALVTPYGATKSDYFAVSERHKLDEQRRVVPGRVGHDRIQQGAARGSIGEAIRRWYGISAGDFERIDIDVEIRDDVFYITPFRYLQTGSARPKEIARIRSPLTFTTDYQSPLWKQQLKSLALRDAKIVDWCIDEICRIVGDHRPRSRVSHVQETDLLRAAGPLALFGVRLGAYVSKGYDCVTEFNFLKYPPYEVPVELKRDSTGFRYQQGKYGREELSRAVLLCALHRHKNLPSHIDVIELEALCQFGKQVAR